MTIRPIFDKNNQLPFRPSQALVIAPPEVNVGHNNDPFVDPEKAIVDGFHIHMDYLEGQKEEALKLRDQFKLAAAKNKVIYSDLDEYPEHSNGPHVRAGWEVKFERAGSQSLSNYGFSLAWLMLNHNEIPLYSHSKSWIFGENEKRLISHLDNALYSGVKPKVNQWFFFNPEEQNSGLYRWDSQLPTTQNQSDVKRQEKQNEILEFWFGKDRGGYPIEQSKKWFNQQSKDPSQFDKTIKDKFANDIILQLNHQYDDWQATPKGALATVILLDQFPRNIYRGQSMAFAFDTLALKVAKSAIQKGFDEELSHTERLFLYLPLEHSENIEDQAMAVKLIESLKNQVPSKYKKIFEVHHQMALKHQKTIEKFKYFPSRKPNFGDKNTAEELRFMQSHGAEF